MVSDKTPHRGDWSTTQQGYKTGSWEHRWIRKAWGCHIKGFSQNAVLWLPSLQFKQTWNASRMSGLCSLSVASMAMENLSLGSVVLCHPWCWLKEEPWGWSECRDKKGHFHMWRKMLTGLEQSDKQQESCPENTTLLQQSQYKQHTENCLPSLTCVLSTHCHCHFYRPRPMAAETLTILASHTNGIVDLRRWESLAYLAMCPAKNQTRWCPATHSCRQRRGPPCLCWGRVDVQTAS